jgi:hypothetical protein
MQETSEFSEDRRIDVTLGVIKRLKMFGMKRYNEAAKDGYHQATSYWDGYMRALSHVLEAEKE